jgi:phosphoribosylpyrophosphate synthetase
VMLDIHSLQTIGYFDIPVDHIYGRGLHSSTFQLNLSRFGHTSPCAPD